MTVEFTAQQRISGEETLIEEHDAYSRAKKVIQGPTYFTPKTDMSANLAPLNGTASTTASQALEANKAYRLISSVDIHFSLSAVAAVATIADIYLPAKTAIIIASGTLWKSLNVIKATGASDGIFQVAEIK